MNNQAAQTMPTPIFTTFERSFYSEDQMRAMYQQGYAAALSQTAGVAGDMAAAESLCRIYFEIAAEAIGEDSVRAERDRRISALAAAPAASGVDTSTNEAWAARAQEKIAAMDAASGGERVPLSERLYRGPAHDPSGSERGLEPQATSESMPPAGPSVSERARALLADEYAKDTDSMLSLIYAKRLRTNDRCEPWAKELRALEQALTQQRGSVPEGMLLVPRWKMNHVANMLDRDGDEHGVSADIRSMIESSPALTTPQPGAEALRELVRRWRGPFAFDGHDGEDWDRGARETMLNCADELESLLGRGGK